MTIDDEGWVARFVAQAPPIDDVRDEAARCCEETARAERGERPPVRCDTTLLSEFSDAAAGTAAEVALKVGEQMRRTGAKWNSAFAWETAAKLLRSGWKRGDRLESHVIAPAEERS